MKFEFGVKNDDYGCVKTDCFADTILSICKTRADEWAFTVQGRVEYYGEDLHAADCLYHRSCDIHFRTFRDIPMQHRVGPSENKRSRKLGRPRDTDQEEAFIRMCAFFEDNDEEQLSITDLANKMEEYLHESESGAYGNQYLKCQLMKHYGDSIYLWLRAMDCKTLLRFVKELDESSEDTFTCRRWMMRKRRREL